MIVLHNFVAVLCLFVDILHPLWLSCMSGYPAVLCLFLVVLYSFTHFVVFPSLCGRFVSYCCFFSHFCSCFALLCDNSVSNYGPFASFIGLDA